MNTSHYAVAPEPPAGPGDLPEDGAVDRYLAELGRWRMRREHELRALDELTRTHDERDALNVDVTTSMALWHAVAQRHDLLLTTWEAATEGEGERDWVAQLIWGVLEMPDGDAQALAITLPEAMRLSDSLATSLRARLGTDEDDLPVADRTAALQDEIDRIRTRLDESGSPAEGDEADQGDDTEETPDLHAQLQELETELEAVRQGGQPEDDGRAAEVRSELGALQSRLVRIDQASIVATASEAHGRADAEQAAAERDHLVAKGEAVRALAERVLNSVHPAPKLGIPDVTALGDLPSDENELSTYVANLERVGRALDQAHATYAAALAEYADLADRAELLAKTLSGCGAPTSVDLAGMLTAAKESLHNQPADIQRASALIAAQEAYLAQLRPDA
ncbi:hypothetical protein [Ornithinimicrobium panacihumi]|uniref:hypothetical protein n=1 Tax=Ornithinimicrobium panacihumi TaxID=2008449 RepID=UPI003F8BBD36